MEFIMAHVFTAVEDKVTGWQLSSETQNEIIEALSKEAQSGLLAKLSMTYNKNADCNEFVFRYKSDSNESTLSVGDYLVELNTGNLVVKSAKDFEANYMHTDCDPVQNHNQSIVDAVIGLFKDNGVATKDAYTIQNVAVAVNGAGWFDKDKNIITLKLNDQALKDFDDFEILYKGAVRAEGIDENTTVVLDLTNNATGNSNLFNLIALQQLLGIFTRMDKTQRARLVSIRFNANSDDYSAVATSVDEATWMNWIDDIRDVTGIKRNSAVTR